MKQHTPTPWTARSVYHKDGRFELRSERRQSVGYAPLAYVRGDKRETGGDGAANAEFIVRACNAHDQLVAALIDAKRLLAALDVDIMDCVDYGNGEHAYKTIERINAALTAAGAA